MDVSYGGLRLERTTYVGPAPVPYDDYVSAMKVQGSGRLRVNQRMMRQALAHMVLEERVFSKVGPAVNSGKSIFFYGPPGNGKTSIAERITRCFGSAIWIPRCLAIDGDIIGTMNGLTRFGPRSTRVTSSPSPCERFASPVSCPA